VGETYYDTASNRLLWWNGTVWVPAMGATPGTVTSLPSSPTDGQEVYYVADATNGVVWHLRYRAGSSSSYKWEFVGGAELRAEVATGETVAVGASYIDFATVGPTVTAPLAGDYNIRLEGLLSTGPNAGGIHVAPKIGAAAANDGDRMSYGMPVAGYASAQCMRDMRRTVTPAGTAVKLQGRSDTAVSGVTYRALSLTPYRVG